MARKMTTAQKKALAANRFVKGGGRAKSSGAKGGRKSTSGKSSRKR